MKKILATLAVAAFAVNATAGGQRTGDKYTDDLKRSGQELTKAHEGVPNPFRPLVGTLLSPAGHTISWVATGVAATTDAVEDAIGAVMASGACLADSTANLPYPGHSVACVVVLGGDLTIVVTSYAGGMLGSTVEHAGAIVADLAFIAGQAATDICSAVADTGIPVVSHAAALPFCVVGVVLDATGRVVRATATTIAQAVYTATGGVNLVIGNTVDVAASLLRLDLGRAVQSLGFAGVSAACTAFDLLLTPVNWINNVAGEFGHGGAPLGTCQAAVRAEFRRIRAGEKGDDYQAPWPGDDEKEGTQAP
jgi:hypothetical protein